MFHRRGAVLWMPMLHNTSGPSIFQPSEEREREREMRDGLATRILWLFLFLHAALEFSQLTFLKYFSKRGEDASDGVAIRWTDMTVYKMD